MRKTRLSALIAIGAATALTAGALAVQVASAADSASTADEIVRGDVPDGDVDYPGKEYIIDNYAKWDEIAEQYAPEIRQLPSSCSARRANTSARTGCSRAGPSPTTRITWTRTTRAENRAMPT